MLDLRFLRKYPELAERLLKSKDPSIDLKEILAKDATCRSLKTQVEELLAKKNAISKEVGELKRDKKDASAQLAQVASLGTQIDTLSQELAATEATLQHQLAALPNLPMEDVPVGTDASSNLLLRSFGEKPSFSFTPKHHVALNDGLKLFDFERASRMSGSGWPIYRGLGARLEWALLQFMINYHISNGFMMWLPPLLVREDAMYGVGQLPKFAQQIFRLSDTDYPLYLIPTSEAALNALHAGETLKSSELPLRYVSYTPCFRREAGAAGSQERGLIRMHQFNKVEMFCFATPEQSGQIFEEMVSYAEGILKALEIHHRSMLLCTWDMSHAAARTVDLEVWLPGQNRYYEVSSVSNCTDYQARRSGTRLKTDDPHLGYVHTLNGSGLATSRLMTAILENGQQEDGSVTIPKVLRPYLDGRTHLELAP